MLVEEKRDHRFKFTKEQEMEIVTLYVNGTRTGILEKQYKVTRSAILGMAKRYGFSEYASTVKGGTPGINTKHLEPEMLKLHSEGKSQKTIGDAVGVSQSVVSRVLRKNNLRPNNIPNSKKGQESNFWKGGKIISGEGYILVLYTKNDIFSVMKTKAGYIPEHRLNMAIYLGRPLLKSESVHHIDGNKQNNDIGNLQLRIGQHGKGSCYKCSDCGSIRIEPMEI